MLPLIMIVYRVSIGHLLLLSSAEFLWAQPKSQPPFWKRNAKIYQKVKSERLVAVSVRAKSVRKPEETLAQKPKAESVTRSSQFRRQLKMAGVGHIAVSSQFAYRVITQYDGLKHMSSYIVESQWDEAKKELFFHTKALGYHARMWLRLNSEFKSESGKVMFLVVRGVFKGLSGELKLRELSSRNSEVTLEANYFYNEVPIPQVFLDFGLEMVLQKMAARMRGYIEEKYKKRKP